MEKTRTTVNIGGKEYIMAGFESEEYIHRVAICVDRKMAELKSQYVNLNPNTLSVLTAINIADDYLKLHDSFDALCKDNEALREQLGSLKQEMSKDKPERSGNVSSIGKKPPSAKSFDSFK